MTNYGLKKLNAEGTLLLPTPNFTAEETTAAQYGLYLTDRLERTEDGRILHRYRLNSATPHTIEMALAYDIKCPRCGNRMKQVGRSLTYHELGEYACTKCDKR